MATREKIVQSTPRILERFFGDYETPMNKALGEPPEFEVNASAAAFADCYVEASPVGIACYTNEEFRSHIKESLERYRSIGTKSMKIVGLDITPLDDLHIMAKVHWDSHYVKKDGDPVQIEFDVIYFVQTKNGQPKIFAYIAGDEQKALQENGLMPS